MGMWWGFLEEEETEEVWVFEEEKKEREVLVPIKKCKHCGFWGPLTYVKEGVYKCPRCGKIVQK